MKRLYILLLILPVLSACTKTLDSAPDTKVVYSFTGNTNAVYNITYTDGSGAPVSTSFQGTTWSKTITTYPYTGFKQANFTVNTATPNANAVGSMNIAVNDNVVINESNLTFSNTNQGYYYYVVVFN
jgi:hypothetical protein